MDPVPSSRDFEELKVALRMEEVVVTCFHNPSSFFCRLLATEITFQNLVNDIQNYFSRVKLDPISVSVGTPILAMNPCVGIMCRGSVMDRTGSIYYVQFVDYGNIHSTDEVWLIEEKFMKLPAQAIHCCLKEVMPIDGEWPSIDLFTDWFNAGIICCNFLEDQEYRYIVELECGGSSLKDTLLESGLVEYDGESYAHYDAAILLGQQIQVTIVDFRRLSLFYVELKTGIRVAASIYKLESATQINDNTFIAYFGLEVIVYVNNVIDNKIAVTLYDGLGNKVIIVEPDDGNPNTIDALCPYPVLYPTISGWITAHCEEEDGSWCVSLQPLETCSSLEKLEKDMLNYYSKITLFYAQRFDLEIGKVYAVHSRGFWRRGRVESFEDDEVEITYVDYGHTKVVTITDLRILIPEFMKYHISAFRLSIPLPHEDFLVQEVTASISRGDNGWIAELHV